MRLNTTKSFVIAMLLGGFFASCGDSNGNQPDPDVTPKGTIEVQLAQIPKQKSEPYNKEFSYFSFMQNKQLDIKNDAAKGSLDWDIAFLGTQGRTNGGESSNGKASVYLTETEDFEGIHSAEEFVNKADGWNEDKMLQNVMLLDGVPTMPPPMVNDSFNPLLVAGSWYRLEGGMPPTIVINKKVFIIRTAKGDKYVKVQFIDLKGKSEAGAPGKMGDVRFRYEFIPLTGKPNTAKRVGEVAFSETGPLSAKIKPEDAAKIKFFVVRNTTLKQEDFDFIKKNMTALHELDLTDATIDVDYNDKLLKDNKVVKKVIMPKNQEFIGRGWLAYTGIEEVVFHPNSLKRIGEGGFSYSQKLRKVNLPESLESIEANAFWACFELESAVVPEKVILIPPLCFYYCKALKSVEIKGNVKTLGVDAFSSCNNLEVIKFHSATPPTYEDYPFRSTGKKGNFHFHVPKGSTMAYIEAWSKQFKPEHKTLFIEF
ncbi:leucine-rich repeat protein [Porphyromonas sp.]|uniref:leucine-rich repeat protein n=1 Tax=Porphyromonas sp. TaxID=1924944 RepID=UPI0026DAAA83|nr:leucine-rich repeat protein [Porphyromonas sp.]MDO4771433.1 leucine-rich repeat protein [Porphyromonas sp.]